MKYFITMNGWKSANDCKYVLTEEDVEKGGWTDIEEENFAIETREKAEAIMARLAAYCQEKGYNVGFSIVEPKKCDFEKLGKALVCFHTSRASWASRPRTSYENDVKSFGHLIERLYTDYYGAGRFYLNNTDEDGEYLDDDEWTLTDCSGNVVLEGKDEIEAPTGTLEIDGDYDTWYVQRLEDCDEKEIGMVYEDGSHHTLMDEDLLAYCCWRLDKKMIVDVDYGKESCTVHFTDGTDGTISFTRGEDIAVTIADFFTENNIDDKSREKWFDKIECEYDDCLERFTLYRDDNDLREGWKCTDQENGIVCRFKAHRFNETQQFEFNTDVEPDAQAIAKAMREMGDWLKENHYEKVF